MIGAEIAGLRPDVIAFNEVSVPLQTAKVLCDGAIAATGIPYKLVQQTRVNGLSKVEGEVYFPAQKERLEKDCAGI